MGRLSQLVSRLRRRALAAPPWAVTVAVVVALGTVTVVLSTINVVDTGFVKPWIFFGGVAAAFCSNHVYTLIVQKSEVLEAIDVSEAPAVALALLLPPGEALLALALGSFLGELRPGRSPAKKAFNVGIRCIGGGLLVLIVDLLRHPGVIDLTTVASVAAGAFVYTLSGLVGVAAVIAGVRRERMSLHLTSAWRPRLGAWTAAVALGVTAATLVIDRPWAVVGILGALELVRQASNAFRREQRERERLQVVVEATGRILDATAEDEQERAVLDAAEKLLLWRDLVVQDHGPVADEVGAPLWRSGARARWLVARPRRGADPWGPEDQRILDALSTAVASAYDRVQLERELARLANLDPLTELRNRRAFGFELDRALRAGDGVAVVLLDLNGFKPVNDRLGHDAGDELLKIVARRLSASVRPGDTVARIGGDEFVVVLPGVTTPEVGDIVAAKVCAAIEQPVHISGWQLSVSASAGVAVAPDDGVDEADLLRRADERMYEVKRAQPKAHFVAVAAERRMGVTHP